MDLETHRLYIKKRITEEGFRYLQDTFWLDASGKKIGWTFDLKHLFLEKEFLHAVCEIFWSIYDRTKPIQIGGEEVASIPLIAALVLSGEKATGFYIRKSRKKKYDLRQLEGKLTDAPVVLVDDIINSGTTIEKQREILKKYHIDISGVFACVHLRVPEQYAYFKENGIRFDTIFSVLEFGSTYANTPVLQKPDLFEEVWRFTALEPHMFEVVRRQQLFVSEKVYLNADDGCVYALKSTDGKVVWKQRVHRRVPDSLSQPGIIAKGEKVYAPSENGSVCAMDSATGKILWRNSVLDHSYGDPELIKDGGVVAVLGRWGNEYAVVLLDARTGSLLWRGQWSQRVAAVLGINKGTQLVLFFVSGEVVCIDVASGKEQWSTQVEGRIDDQGVIDHETNQLFLATRASKVYVLDAYTGKVIRSRKVTHMPFLSAMPVIYGDVVYLTSLHRTVYALRRDTLEILWEFDMKGRIFSRPTVTEKYLYIGNNEGILYAFERETGKLLGKFVATERFVSEPFVDEKTGDLIIATIANEVYRLKHKEISKNEKSA